MRSQVEFHVAEAHAVRVEGEQRYASLPNVKLEHRTRSSQSCVCYRLPSSCHGPSIVQPVMRGGAAVSASCCQQPHQLLSLRHPSLPLPRLPLPQLRGTQLRREQMQRLQQTCRWNALCTLLQGWHSRRTLPCLLQPPQRQLVSRPQRQPPLWWLQQLTAMQLC